MIEALSILYMRASQYIYQMYNILQQSIKHMVMLLR